MAVYKEIDDPEEFKKKMDELMKTKEFEYLKGAGTVLTDIANGAPIQTIIQSIADIAGAGAVVKLIFSLTPSVDQIDPVIKALGDLSTKVDNLSKHLDDSFKDMKAFTTEQTFYSKVSEAATLSRFMQDTLNRPTEKNFENFESECKKNTPTHYAYVLLELLRVDSTNPLKMAMEADPLKTTATFQKWRSTINGVFAQLVLVESYSSGIFKDKNLEDAEQLKGHLLDYDKLVDGWASEYKKDYWPGVVKRFVEENQDNSTEMSAEQRGTYVKECLEKVLTDDAFYIMVYYRSNDPEISTFNEKTDGAQIFKSINRGNCSIVVYRSLTGKTLDEKKLEQIKEAVNHLKQPFERPDADALWKDGLAGFVGIMQPLYKPSVQSANCPHQWGPGWWIENAMINVHFHGIFGEDRGTKPFPWFLVAGAP